MISIFIEIKIIEAKSKQYFIRNLFSIILYIWDINYMINILSYIFLLEL